MISGSGETFVPRDRIAYAVNASSLDALAPRATHVYLRATLVIPKAVLFRSLVKEMLWVGLFGLQGSGIE